jgi:hypothetical protein
LRCDYRGVKLLLAGHGGMERIWLDVMSVVGTLIRPFCITILYHNLLLFIDIFHI